MKQKLKMLMMLFMLSIGFVSAQNNILKITGKISDQNNSPLPGVTILVKGTNNGASTDFDGKYSINVKDRNATLLFSYIGYKTQEIKVSNQTTIDLVMEEDLVGLDQVVVVGYGTTKKDDLTGAISVVKGEDLVVTPTGNALNSLQGQVSGVQITSSSGAPGAGVEILIRGASSISGGTQPLYVIDGIQLEADGSDVARSETDQISGLGPLSFLNPDDIESINILKDASATAIYGSRGANGVVIITTRSGKFNHRSLSVSVSQSLSILPDEIDVLGLEDYIDYRHFRDPGGDPIYSTNIGTDLDPVFVAREYSPDQIIDRRLQDELFRAASNQTVNISFANGGEDSNVSASLGFLDQNGIVLGTDYNRVTSNLKYRLNVNDRITVNSTLNAAYSKTNAVRASGDGNLNTSGVIGSILNAVPGIIVNEDGLEEDPENNGLASPADLIEFGVNNTSFSKFIGSLGVDYKITEKLIFRSQVSSQLSFSEANLFYPSFLPQGAPDGRARVNTVTSKRLDFQNTLTYNGNLGGNSTYKLLGGIETRTIERSAKVINNRGFALGLGGVDNIQEGINLQSPTSFRNKESGASFFFSGELNLLDKYLLTGTFRADGSSKFGAENKYGYFYSVSGAWKLKNENFLKDSNVISQLTLKGSYGTVGNDRIGNGLTQTNYRIGFYPNFSDDDQVALQIANIGDPTLKWETTKQFNLGLDAGLFKNKISLDFNVYRKQTTDLLLQAEIPGHFGQARQVLNIGRVDNEGIELGLTARIINGKKFSWKAQINGSINKSTVVDLGDTPERIISTGTARFRNLGILREGEPIGTLYGFIYDGFYDFEDFSEFDGLSRQEAADIYDSETTYTLRDGIASNGTPRPGNYKFKNLVDEEGSENIITDLDRTIIGNSNPDLSGGITNDFTYGGLSLKVNMVYSYGNDIYNASRVNLEGSRASHNVSQQFYDNFWRPDGSVYELPSALDSGGKHTESTYYVEDGSFLRIKAINLSYTFEDIKKFGINALTVFASANNVWTFTNYSGYDPEIRGRRSLVRGIDRATYPRSSTISMGLNVKF